MAKVLPSDVTYIADLLRKLGNIPAKRVRLTPAPGTATERDVLLVERREDRLCELVDGTLVEKVMSAPESYLAVEIIVALRKFDGDDALGFVLGADGMARVMPGLVRIPDVSFFSWNHFSDRMVPSDPIARQAPDLAVEVLSPSNTRQEIARKLKEYFLGGTRLAWVIDPRKRSAKVHTAPDVFTSVGEDGALDGGDVLPGFRLALRDLFARLSPLPAARKKRPRGA